ncbi:B3 DNA binding domain - like 10 [Theobroma cacao]|nr:B3 DNA binding domain - like 10 [Theobroma cacao]
MVVARQELSYEECRRKRVEENKKRMEALNLPQLSQALRTPSFKPSPFRCLFPDPQRKQVKPRTGEKQLVVVRRSSRVANKPAPVYHEVLVEKVIIPRRRVSKHRDLSNRVYASDEARAEALEKAEKLESGLEPDFPTLTKSMLQSHVTGGFWLGLPVHFCKRNLPKRDEVMTLIDEEGQEYPAIYLARKTGLSGGWKGFAVAHKLVDGDALVFQLVRPTTFKVYIIRVKGSEQSNKL